jgi:hypothetical protein
MFQTKQWVPVVGTALMLAGCQERQPTGPSMSGAATAQSSFANGPSTPNVFRTASGFVFGIPDPEGGLIAWAGLPESPGDAIECGGTEDFDLTPIQSAGQLQEAFNLLARNKNMHIHVYDIDTFSDTCTDTPLAAGTGNFGYNDNDAPVAGPGANSFGGRMQGTLRLLSTGGLVRVTAASRAQNLPDGSFRFVNSHVNMHPIGKP